MSDTVSTLASKLRPHWLRDLTNGSGGISSAGGGSGMVAHALSGPFHTGELDPSQAPWAATLDDLAAIDTHPRQHDVFDTADHIANGAQWQVGGFTALNTWGKLTPSSNVSAGTEALLKSDAAGGLTLAKLRAPLIDTASGGMAISPASTLTLSPANNVTQIGVAMTLYGDGSVTAGPDILFNSHGLLAAQGSMYLNIDSDSTGTDAALVFLRDSGTNAGTELGRLTEAGQLSVLTNVRTPLIDTASGNLQLNSASGLVSVGSAMYFSTAGTATVAPDILFATNGLLAAEGGMYFAIDTANALSNSSFNWFSGDDVVGGSGAELMTLAENGYLTVAGRVRAPRLGTATNELTIAPETDILLDAGSGLTKLTFENSFQSDDYASQTTGMRITHLGEGDFRYIYTDELHAKAFIADLEQALAGGQIITKSVAVLALPFTAPAAGDAAFLYVEDLPSAEDMAVFESGDIVRLRQFSRAGGSLSITNCWGVVTSYLDLANKVQRWTFTRSTGSNAGAMTAGAVVAAKAIVLDYGTTGNGFYEVNAIDGAYALNSPYAQIVSWTVHPATGQKVRARLGNLRGIFSVADEYGLYAGDGTANLSAYLRISSDTFRINNINLQMYNSGGQTFHLASDGSTMWIGPDSANKQLNYASGSLTLIGSITANAGYIGGVGGWEIVTGALTSTSIGLYSGASGRVEVGTAPNQAGITGNSGGGAPLIWAGSAYGDRATAPFRVSAAGAMTSTSGLIANWTIAASSLTSTSLGIYSGSSNRVEAGSGESAAGITGNSGGGAPLVWAGSSYGNRATAPFRVSAAGAMTATSGAIGGWTLGATSLTATNIGMYSGASGTARVVAGSGATSAGVISASGSSGVAFWAGSAYDNITAATPFQVTLGGALTSTSATFGTMLIDTTGAFIVAPTSFNINYGYKFKLGGSGGSLGAGLTTTYQSGDRTDMQLWNNSSTEAGVSPLYSGINSALTIRNVAGGASKTSVVDLQAVHASAGTQTQLTMSNNGTTREIRMYAGSTYINDNIVYHAGNLSSGLGSYATTTYVNTADALLAPKADPTFTGLATMPTMSITQRTTEPSLSSGQVLVFVTWNTAVRRFVIAYNDPSAGSTVKYRYLKLESTNATWEYETNWANLID